MRKDGKTKSTLMILALILGLFGAEYFYLNKTKWGWMKLIISWLGATTIILIWIIYGTKIATFMEIAGAEKMKAIATAAGKAASVGITDKVLEAAAFDAAFKATLVLQSTIDAGPVAAKAYGEVFHIAVIVISALGALMMSVSLLWSFYNALQIQTGEFVDEFGNKVSTWKASKEDFAEYLLRGE